MDSAITFLRSDSKVALIPAINIVSVAIQRRLGQKKLDFLKKGKKRIKRKTPAVTRVEEWTSAETGVGAAIAAGSQLEKGICALFVIAATVIAIVILAERGDVQKNKMFQWPWERAHAILRRIITSPTRLARIVNIPAAKDFAFW